MGWGGLVGTIALAASAGATLWMHALIIIVAFIIVGFLAGVRTLDHRVFNATAAWVTGWLLWAVIDLVLVVVNAAGGPTEPEFAPGTDRVSLLIAAVSLLAAIVGGLTADRRYGGRRIRRRY